MKKDIKNKCNDEFELCVTTQSLLNWEYKMGPSTQPEGTPALSVKRFICTLKRFKDTTEQTFPCF